MSKCDCLYKQSYYATSCIITNYSSHIIENAWELHVCRTCTFGNLVEIEHCTLIQAKADLVIQKKLSHWSIVNTSQASFCET